MKFLSLILAAALSLGSFSFAMAACSPEEAQNKALAFAQAMQDKAAERPFQLRHDHAGSPAQTS